MARAHAVLSASHVALASCGTDLSGSLDPHGARPPTVALYDGTLTHEQGKELLYAFVDYEIGPTVH
jgi:hypothetical protein